MPEELCLDPARYCSPFGIRFCRFSKIPIAEIATARAERNPSQNHPVSWAEITADSSWTRKRSRFIRKAARQPPTKLINGEISVRRFTALVNAIAITTSIDTGSSQSEVCVSRARSKPVRVSLAPAQLTCTQGRKKQIRTMMAALRLMRLSILSYSPDHSKSSRFGLGIFLRLAAPPLDVLKGSAFPARLLLFIGFISFEA